MNKDFKILIVDDEKNQRETLAGFLKKQGFSIHISDSHDSALEILNNHSIDLVLSDFKMEGKNGFDLLISAKELNPNIFFIIMTAFGTVDCAVDIMRHGANDFLQKPIKLDQLMSKIKNIQNMILTSNEHKQLQSNLEKRVSFNSIISNSKEMEQVLSTVSRAADSMASIMIRGESGTGKELIARAIHEASARKDEAFVVVNCAALPDNLFESELFGYEKGAFTGANTRRIGKFEQANKGTLFIDELGDIPLSVQVKMLRAVQFSQIERLGGNDTINLDVRIITATNRNLEEMIQNREFREDLYYRFNVVNIDLPPLRNRKLDIPPLVDHFLKKYNDINGRKIKSFSKDALDMLMKYSYPGNIRELENIIQRAVVLARYDIISCEDLAPEKVCEVSSDNTIIDEISPLNEKVKEVEIQLIKKALEESRGNQVQAAKLLEISERTLRYKLSKYKMK